MVTLYTCRFCNCWINHLRRLDNTVGVQLVWPRYIDPCVTAQYMALVTCLGAQFSYKHLIESLAAGFNDDDFVNEIWTNSASQVQNEVTIETNDDAEIPDEDVEQEEHEEEEEQDQRPVRNKKDKLCSTGGHSLHWRKWMPQRK